VSADGIDEPLECAPTVLGLEIEAGQVGCIRRATIPLGEGAEVL